jgi:hypothetical protein
MAFFLNEKFASKIIYGLITVMALLAVLELHPPSALAAMVTLFGTALALALAEAYAEMVARMLHLQREPSSAEFRHLWRDVSPIVSSALPAIAILFLALFDILSVGDALELAQIVGIGLLFLYGFRIGQSLHEPLLRQMFTGIFMASAGLLIVLIKVLLH